jgi:hypothetical protein
MNKYYEAIRKDPKQWAERLKYCRERYARVGHKKIPSTCIVCGKKWLGTARKRKFCSQKCVSSGVHNGNYKGGRYVNIQGYVCIWNPTVHSRYELEHRAIMEIHLQRKLTKNEDVHHINGIKTDNRVENLQVMSISDHSKLHWKKIKNENLL